MKKTVSKILVGVLVVVVALYVAEYLGFACQSESGKVNSVKIERAK